MEQAYKQEQISLVCPDTGDDILMYFEFVTPELAHKLLETNHKNNRKVNKRQVEMYAHDIKAGLWRSTTGEPIKLAKCVNNQNPKLIDGQHRLNAVILAKKPVYMLFISGIDEKLAFSALDSGLKRSFKDALHIDGHFKGSEQRIAQCVSNLRIYHRIVNQKTRWETARQVKDSNAELITFAGKLPNLASELQNYFNTFVYGNLQKNFNNASAMLCWYLFHDIDPDTTFSVMKSFETGTPFDDLKDKSACHKVMMQVRQRRELKQVIRCHAYVDMFIFAYIMTKKGEPVNRMHSLQEFSIWNNHEDVVKARQKLMRL